MTTQAAQIQQATIDSTIRTSKSLLWGISISMSWVWGIGLFFSVQIAVQFGVHGLVSFATTNAMGLVLFGLYTSRIAGVYLPVFSFTRQVYPSDQPSSSRICHSFCVPLIVAFRGSLIYREF